MKSYFISAFRFVALSVLIGFLGFATKAQALAMDYDAGLRVSIYDENYKMGLGGELGLIAPVDSNWSLGLHLNATLFRAKTETWVDVNEYGGYITGYYNPHVNQPFTLLLGPHLGYAKIADHNFDLGADLMATFLIKPTLNFYANFVPSMMIGKDSQSLIRFGIGLQYRMGH